MESFDFTRCKCFKRPWGPPEECFHYCSTQFLRLAKEEDLQIHLNLNEALASKIFELTANESLTMLPDFQSFLTEDEYNEIENKLRNLDYRAFQWFVETSKAATEVEEPVPV